MSQSTDPVSVDPPVDPAPVPAPPPEPQNPSEVRATVVKMADDMIDAAIVFGDKLLDIVSGDSAVVIKAGETDGMTLFLAHVPSFLRPIIASEVPIFLEKQAGQIVGNVSDQVKVGIHVGLLRLKAYLG